jgi:hypothetical protein
MQQLFVGDFPVYSSEMCTLVPSDRPLDQTALAPSQLLGASGAKCADPGSLLGLRHNHKSEKEQAYSVHIIFLHTLAPSCPGDQRPLSAQPVSEVHTSRTCTFYKNQGRSKCMSFYLSQAL